MLLAMRNKLHCFRQTLILYREQIKIFSTFEVILFMCNCNKITLFFSFPFFYPTPSMYSTTFSLKFICHFLVWELSSKANFMGQLIPMGLVFSGDIWQALCMWVTILSPDLFVGTLKVGPESIPSAWTGSLKPIPYGAMPYSAMKHRGWSCLNWMSQALLIPHGRLYHF